MNHVLSHSLQEKHRNEANILVHIVSVKKNTGKECEKGMVHQALLL